MKNDSPFFPIDTPMDSFFDSNHDGKLSGMETAFRDATLMDSYEHFNEANDNSVLDDTDFMFSNIDDIDDFEFIGNVTTPPVQEPKSEIPEGNLLQLHLQIIAKRIIQILQVALLLFCLLLLLWQFAYLHL